MKQAGGIQRLLVHTALILICGSAAVPFFWMLSTSFKTLDRAMSFPPQLIPSPFVPENYTNIIANPHSKFLLWTRNTLVIAVLGVLGTTLSSALVAYGFAKLRFIGRGPLFVLMLSTMMLPFPVTMVSLFTLFRWLGDTTGVAWLGTFKPLWVPAWFGSAFNIFLLRQFFMTIPTELEDAARIDGASSFQILRQIVIPLSMPALATVAIFSFIYHWNDFLHPLLYLSSKEMKTLALGLALFKGEYSNDWNLMMAASVMALLPCLTIFFLAQRYFIEGITMTGLKQ